ncbi:MAG: hypothetical protein ACYC4U_23945, partial [Pirellulaceae bacterium]
CRLETSTKNHPAGRTAHEFGRLSLTGFQKVQSLFNPQPKARKQIVPILAETSRILAFGCGLNNDGATAYGNSLRTK